MSESKRERDGKHTPGPWFSTPTLEIHARDERETIVTTVTGAPSNPQAVADAHLIAAAPDLLAALESAPIELPLLATVNAYRLWMNDYISWRTETRAAALARVKV